MLTWILVLLPVNLTQCSLGLWPHGTIGDNHARDWEPVIFYTFPDSAGTLEKNILQSISNKWLIIPNSRENTTCQTKSIKNELSSQSKTKKARPSNLRSSGFTWRKYE